MPPVAGSTCQLPCAACRPVAGSLFDFGLYFFHNAKELLARGSGPYFYLPKMQSHLECRLWNEVFLDAQAQLGIPRGTIKVSLQSSAALSTHCGTGQAKASCPSRIWPRLC